LIRKAVIADVKTIHKMIAEQAQSGHILARPISEIYSQVRDFSVTVDPETDEIVGCGALHVVWEDLAEIRSLAVKSSLHGKGVGSALVEALLEECRGLGIKRVFVLTYRQTFFERQGFEVMEKSLLPHKIWADCMRCTRFPECDEIALVRSL
jgi:amino-acid N-acetyltransferase